jgi:hypothetical protein
MLAKFDYGRQKYGTGVRKFRTAGKSNGDQRK